MMHESTDVLIVGGGPSGAAAGIILSQSGLSVTIVEQSDYCHFRVGESLPPSVTPHLTSLGVINRFIKDKHIESFGVQSAWGKESLSEREFIFNPYGKGWHIDRQQFDKMLATAAHEKGANLLINTKLITCQQNKSNQWISEVSIKGQRKKISSYYIIDASGSYRAVGHRLGAQKIKMDQLIGVAGLFQANKETKPLALIEAQENGWWYSAPIPGDKMVVIYMTDADLYAHGVKKTPFFWHDNFYQTCFTQKRTSASKLKEPLKVFAANTYKTGKVKACNWFPTGAAALGLDPLSSSGVSFALHSGRLAARSILQEFKGTPNAREQYLQALDSYYEEYLKQRFQCYSWEERWPQAEFWKRRAQRL